MKSITNPMIRFVANNLELPRCGRAAHDQVEELKRVFTQYRPSDNSFQKYYLIIHSMDMGDLRMAEYQKYISELSAIRGIQLIVSVDNIKAAVMWNDQMIDKYNFCAVNIDTFEEYDVEQDY